MSFSQEVAQLARNAFVLALRQCFDCRVPANDAIIPEEIRDRDGDSLRLKWVTQDGVRYVTHAEGQFYPTASGGHLDIFPRLRVPNRPDLDANKEQRGYLVLLHPDGSIQLTPADVNAAT